MSGSPSKEDVEPKRLELSVNPEDGSLLTTPLSTVLLAATDGLYTDLYNVAHGELEVTTAAQQGEGDEEEAAPAASTKKEKMANLSFAQRRHELAWRLVQHGKGLTHVAALTAANASTDFSNATRISTKALQHARTAWVQADEAQDALYFFHAQLFPARQSPHDVYGALDLQLIGKWLDMPTDLRLTVDRFHNSREAKWSAKEVSERWQMAVRDKLLRGEIAWMKRNASLQPKPLWSVSLKGGIVRLTHGIPKITVNNPPLYPIEALVTVLSTATPNEWSLLSVEVRAQPKTGESSHQLEATNRQRYNLHRLCSLAMSKEEARIRKLKEEQNKDENPPAVDMVTGLNGGDSKSAPKVNGKPEAVNGEARDTMTLVAKPLDRLFQVAHTFALSWQLEILSAQAQALKRGNWAAGETQPIVVRPVQFAEPNSKESSGHNNSNVIGTVSMSFWKVDDQYGPPYMADLYLDRGENDAEQQSSMGITPPVTNQLTLSIRAEMNVGIRVSLSGGMPHAETQGQAHLRATLQELLDAASNPFALSASGALLAATRLCAEQKCRAVVEALQPSNSLSRLPAWIHLTVERSSIAVNAQLLRLLACNDVHASESTTLRILGLPQKRRRVAGANAMGRIVRDVLDGLTRSMNALGHRAGVGGVWKERDAMSASLRQRAIQMACSDVRVGLIKSCGIASMYGLAALALGVATGVTVTHDMAGDPIDTIGGISLLPAPPVNILLDHRLIESETKSLDGEKKRTSYIEQELFAVCCNATADGLTLYPVDVTVHLDTHISAPRRISCSLIQLKQLKNDDEATVNGTRDQVTDRAQISSNKPSASFSVQDLSVEVERLALLMSDALGSILSSVPHSVNDGEPQI